MKRTNKLSLLVLVLCLLFIAPINTKAAGTESVPATPIVDLCNSIYDCLSFALLKPGAAHEAYFSSEPITTCIYNAKTDKLVDKFDNSRFLDNGRRQSYGEYIDVSKYKPGLYYAKFCIRVDGVDSKWSKPAYFISHPYKVKAKQTSKSKVKLSWSKVTGAKSYTVYVSTSRYKKGVKVLTTKRNYCNISKYKGKSLNKLNKKLYFHVVSNATVKGSKVFSCMDYTPNASIKLRKK